MSNDVVRQLCHFGPDRSSKLILAHAPIDRRYQDASQHYAPSLAMMALKTAVYVGAPHVATTVLDGTQICLDEIISEIKGTSPHLVGVSIQQISYDNALRIAAIAKEVGATVIFGGQHATQLATEIIENQHHLVDAVVSNDGELPLVLICHGVPFEQIPGVTYWNGSSVRSNQAVQLGLEMYPAIDYNGVDLRPYTLRYTSRLHLAASRTFLRTYSHKGCANRYNSSACYFCGRADVGVRFKSPEYYFDELVALRDRWGAYEVFDVGDDIAYSKSWLRDLATLVETADFRLRIGCFGRACRLRDPEVASLLRRIGVTNVIIGFESGDDGILRNCGKGMITAADNFNAARNLFDEGIDVCASYVIGLPGETEESLQRTCENAKGVVDLARKHLGREPHELVANLFEPSPGSPAFNRVKHAFPEKYAGKDRLDLAEVQHDFFRVHWDLATPDAVNRFRTMLVTWATQINSLTVEADCQGFRTDEFQTSESIALEPDTLVLATS